jgi:hypothetical protein
VDLLLRSDHDTLTEEVLSRMLASASLAIDEAAFAQNSAISAPPRRTNKNRAYLVDRLAISLGNKHLGGWTGVDTIEDLGLGRVSA